MLSNLGWRSQPLGVRGQDAQWLEHGPRVSIAHANVRDWGAPKAITATAHKLARILYNMMRYGIEYVKKTEADYQEHQRDRQERNLFRRAKQLGYRMEKIGESEKIDERSQEPATAE